MQNPGMPGQIPPGLYGANFAMAGMNGGGDGAAATAAYGQMHQ